MDATRRPGYVATIRVAIAASNEGTAGQAAHDLAHRVGALLANPVSHPSLVAVYMDPDLESCTLVYEDGSVEIE